ncbi:hypothetical protein ACQKEY_24635 [Lysinibacillus fusiformis]|uniref:hypothetical protein n=1 Tax=Lysinibacillus fusiformis TaxID=28031 RepID=UPI003D008BC7
MANKRLRKKQKAKNNINLLNKIGVTDKKKIKELKNDTQKTTAIYKKEQRRITANERSAIIKRLGYKVSDHSGKRYWSENRWSEWVAKESKKQQVAERKKQQRIKRQKSDAEEYHLIILWSDKTAEGYADEDIVKVFKQEYKYMSTESLIQLINFYLYDSDAKGVEIGKANASIIHGSQIDSYLNFMTHVSKRSNLYENMHDWVVVYKGKVKRYKELLLAILTTIRLMYDHTERSDFINILLDNLLPQINPKMRNRLAKDINWGDF